MRIPLLFLSLLLLTTAYSVVAQDSLSGIEKIVNFPDRFLVKINKKANTLENKLVSYSEKALNKLEKQEQKLKRKLAKKDSLAAVQVFGDVKTRYNQLRNRLSISTNPLNNSGSNNYLPYIDTLQTSLKFLGRQGEDFLRNRSVAGINVPDALKQVNGLDAKFSQANAIRDYLRQHKAELKEKLEQFGMVKELRKINKEVYYYSQQIKEYKSILNDPSKIERKAIELLSKTKLFQDFMRKNSMLASLFRVPLNSDDPVALQGSLAGLQTRAQMQQLIQQQIAAGGPNAMAQVQQNLQQGQAQLNQLKNKISQLGGGGSSDEEELDFKPNDEKTKSFFDRVELGMNMQSTRGNNYFPVTTDLGLSVGYKVNAKSVVGVGISGKLGWGQNWQQIKFTQQGVGLRSFVDWKIKWGLYLGGGFEMNYWPSLEGVVIESPIGREIPTVAWQKSGLIGVSKVVALKTKLFKNTRVQLLFDFLSYQQVPRTQPLIFRAAYALK